MRISDWSSDVCSSDLSLIAADERDIVRLRSNVRREDVDLYRVALSPSAIRSLFLAYLTEAESLRRRPRWYNTATANCTTVVFEMMRHIVGRLPFDHRLQIGRASCRARVCQYV